MLIVSLVLLQIHHVLGENLDSAAEVRAECELHRYMEQMQRLQLARPLERTGVDGAQTATFYQPDDRCLRSCRCSLRDLLCT